MNTITIDSGLYDRASAYARKHKTSVRKLVEHYIAALPVSNPTSQPQQKEYYISPQIRALSMGFQLPDNDVSLDYKKEIGEMRMSRYK